MKDPSFFVPDSECEVPGRRKEEKKERKRKTWKSKPGIRHTCAVIQAIEIGSLGVWGFGSFGGEMEADKVTFWQGMVGNIGVITCAVGKEKPTGQD